MKKRIIMKTVPKSEDDFFYGKRQIKVGESFSDGESHYYQQREFDVLHVCGKQGEELINILHVGYLNKPIRNITPISNDDFSRVKTRVCIALGLITINVN